MKLAFLICALVMLAILPWISPAHPGGLDSKGGHWDRKAGTYHQHKAPSEIVKPTSPVASTPQQDATPALDRTRRLYTYWQTANTGLVNQPIPEKVPRDVSATQKKKILERDGNRCVVCGSTQKLEVDHKVALMNGGNNSSANLATLCDECHTEKTKLDNSLRRKREKLGR